MTRRVILAGGGHAHLAVLADWANRPWPDTQRWLAGIYTADDLRIDLAPLVQRAGAQLVVAEVIGLDPARRILRLSSGEDMEFDLLSLATGGETETSALAPADDRLLPVRPVGTFMERWTQRLEAQTLTAPFNIAVVGGGAAGVELALGVDAALRKTFRSYRVSLVTPSDGFLSGHVKRVRRLAQQALSDRGIALHFARAAGADNGLRLSDGAFLPADCIIAATGSRAPRWLAQSGLACNRQGFVAVGADLRSTSHPGIFAAGDIIDRADRSLARSGVHAVKAGPVLAANLRASLSGGALQHYRPRNRTLYLLALGDRRAIVSWGQLAGAGRCAWLVKDRIDRNFVGRYTDKSRP